MKLTELNPRWAVGSEWREQNGVMIFNQDNYWNR